MQNPHHLQTRRGFTLIELLIVMSIVGLLLTLAVPRYFHSIDTARETVSAANLVTLRDAIDKFFQDTASYPESLEELVEKRYLRALPLDPLTRSATTWVIVAPPESVSGRVYDVRTATGSDHSTATAATAATAAPGQQR